LSNSLNSCLLLLSCTLSTANDNGENSATMNATISKVTADTNDMDFIKPPLELWLRCDQRDLEMGTAAAPAIEMITLATIFPTAEDKKGFRFSGQLCQEGHHWAGGDARPRRARRKYGELAESAPRLLPAIRVQAGGQDWQPLCCRA